MNQRGRLLLKLRDSQGKVIHGEAEIRLRHHVLCESRVLRSVGISKEIAIENLYGEPHGHYRIEIEVPTFKFDYRFVNIRASGVTELEIRLARSTPGEEPVPPKPIPRGFTIHGQLRHADGRLGGAVTVRVYEKLLTEETPLGKALTDTGGDPLSGLVHAARETRELHSSLLGAYLQHHGSRLQEQ